MNTTAAERVSQEVSQSKARLAVTLVALTYLLLLWVSSGAVSMLVVRVLVGYALFSAAWLLLVRSMPGEFVWRRITVIVSDLGINTFFMAGLGAKGAIFYPMYLWIIVGNGMRFGPRYLVISMVLGVAYFGPMMVLSPYWRTNAVAGSGLLAGMVVLPLFYLSLIRKLQETNLRLAREVERAQEADRSKSEFLANMSHELRTPMGGVIGVAELLRDTPLNPAQKEHVDLIQRSAQSLLRVIDDVLEVSKIESGKTLLGRVSLDLYDILDDVLHLLTPSADEKGIELRSSYPEDTPRVFRGDPTRIRQIFFNIVGNAIKFTERGHVTVDLSYEPQPDGRALVRIGVADTGVGIAPDKLAHVFDEFEQADTRLSRKFGGTGLGLTISRHLARLMGGDVTVASELGRGSTFTVTLFLEQGHERPLSESKLEVLTTKYPLRVLVVEDNEVNQVVVKAFLEKMGMTIVLAEDGESAVQKHRSEDFDLVLMDVQLPKMDGLEATRRIRAQENGQVRVPIVALTANAFAEDHRACLEAGMDLHLQKPIRLIDLHETMATLEQMGLLPENGKRGA